MCTRRAVVVRPHVELELGESAAGEGVATLVQGGGAVTSFGPAWEFWSTLLNSWGTTLPVLSRPAVGGAWKTRGCTTWGVTKTIGVLGP